MNLAELKRFQGKRSELRKDPISGDWIVLAPRRMFRPHPLFASSRRIEGAPSKASIKKCLFEHPDRLNGVPPVLIYGTPEDWSVQIIPNKFPAVTHEKSCAERFKLGPYTVAEGVGYHELLITRDHTKTFSDLDSETAWQVFQGFRERYLVFMKDPCVKYVTMFQNWGTFAGASVAHPHYQIIAIPVVPPHVEHSLRGSLAYFKKNKACAHCAMIKFELKQKHRIIFENDRAVAIAPFASREPFEIHVFPKRHLPYFEETGEKDFNSMIHVFQQSLRMMKKALKDPDYNFYIHTSPVRHDGRKKFSDYHWHIEILPKLNIWAGFELGTGIEINTVDPNVAAAILRKAQK